ELADGFIILPGGLGSLDEFFESWSWLQLGYHTKPCGILNIANYFDPLIAFLDHATTEGFLGSTQRNALIVENDPISLLQKFASYQAPPNRIYEFKTKFNT
ncbi:MAG TPA: LOG family protein, partial [Bacteroidia bacterium]|nr:LOG family protein [Bacteroidia bacterium]